MGKIVITRQKNRLLMALFDEKRPWLLESAALPENESILGNIYLAKVRNVVSGMKGAFLAISNEHTVYLPFNECSDLLCVNRDIAEVKDLHQGDEIVVQITGEALKTKQPTASTRLTLTGQYCVCSYFGHGIRFSKKISTEDQNCLGQSIKNEAIEGRKQYQFTIRTNADALDDLSPLFEEMKSFIHIFNDLKETYEHRTCYTVFYRTEPEIIRFIQNLPLGSYEEIITDELPVYDLLEDHFKGRNLRLYQDSMISLSKLYSMDTHLQEALSKKVWLPCGGYLIIEPTEAMVVIDVNSGKAESRKKKSTDYYLKVNLEAAKETARQLRLRNYSGIIMVDFINMESEEDNRKLLEYLDTCLKEDKVRTRLVDMTKLGIVEITRKKISRPIADYFSEIL
ncbi:MAG: ribonuclease E/G [Lachnospiraceae bacterium]|nr:ribonuclease E/G [Lachnospiraceae bacterium]